MISATDLQHPINVFMCCSSWNTIEILVAYTCIMSSRYVTSQAFQASWLAMTSTGSEKLPSKWIHQTSVAAPHWCSCHLHVPLGFCCCQIHLKHLVCGFCVIKFLDSSSCPLEPTVELRNIFAIVPFSYLYSVSLILPSDSLCPAFRTWVIFGWHLWPFLVLYYRSPVCLG